MLSAAQLRELASVIFAQRPIVDQQLCLIGGLLIGLNTPPSGGGVLEVRNGFAADPLLIISGRS